MLFLTDEVTEFFILTARLMRSIKDSANTIHCRSILVHYKYDSFNLSRFMFLTNCWRGCYGSE